MNEIVQSCPKCDSEMVEGFILNRSVEVMRPSYWIDGSCEPPDSETGAVGRIAEQISKLVNKIGIGKLINQIGKSRLRRGLRIRTFRCTDCGFLESYASSE